MTSVTNFYNHLPDGDKLKNRDALKLVSVKKIFTNQTKSEMKESAKILTLIMVVIFGFAAIANTVKNQNNTTMQIIPCTMGVFKLVYLKDSKKGVQVGVMDEKGEVIKYDEITGDKGFIQEYDLKANGSGTYVFRVQDSTGNTDQSVFYDKEHKLAICEMGIEGKFKVILDSPENINITVFDEDHNLLDSKSFNTSKQIVKVFDLSNKMDGTDEISFMIKENNDFLKIATFQ